MVNPLVKKSRIVLPSVSGEPSSVGRKSRIRIGIGDDCHADKRLLWSDVKTPIMLSMVITAR